MNLLCFRHLNNLSCCYTNSGNIFRLLLIIIDGLLSSLKNTLMKMFTKNLERKVLHFLYRNVLL